MVTSIMQHNVHQDDAILATPEGDVNESRLDADLIGCPYQVVIGEKNLSQGLVELKERRTGTVTKLAPAGVTSSLTELLRPVLS
jgi:prolyl-tRNA synthetase